MNIIFIISKKIRNNIIIEISPPETREYKIKLEGGLETLGLLEGDADSDVPAAEAPAE